MKDAEIDKLRAGQSLTLRDGRKVTLLNIMPFCRKEGEAWVLVTEPDNYKRFLVWPAQIAQAT